MTTYRVEYQLPYGTLVDVYEGPEFQVAVSAKARYLRLGKGRAFVPCFINGKEVPPTRFNTANRKKLKEMT